MADVPMTDLEKAAYIASNVLEWCEPIGMDKHMVWYQEAGHEIADAIRHKLDEMVKLCDEAGCHDGEPSTDA